MNPHSELSVFFKPNFRWDVFTACAVVFTAIVAPYEVANLKPRLNVLFIVNRLIDVIFIADIGFSFFLAFRPEGGKSRLICDLKSIRRHYLQTWFTVDFLAALPSDVLALKRSDGREGIGDALLGGEMGGRLLRLIRLLKLVRLLKIRRIYQRYEAELGIPYAYLSLMNFFVRTEARRSLAIDGF